MNAVTGQVHRVGRRGKLVQPFSQARCARRVRIDDGLEPAGAVATIRRREHLLAFCVDDRHDDRTIRHVRQHAERKRLDRGDAADRDAKSLPQSQGCRDTDAKPGESSRPDADHDLIEVSHADPDVRQQAMDFLGHATTCTLCRVEHTLGHGRAVTQDREAGSGCCRVECERDQ